MTDFKMFKITICIATLIVILLGMLMIACDLSGDPNVDIIEVESIDCDQDAEEYLESE